MSEASQCYMREDAVNYGSCRMFLPYKYISYLNKNFTPLFPYPACQIQPASQTANLPKCLNCYKIQY